MINNLSNIQSNVTSLSTHLACLVLIRLLKQAVGIILGMRSANERRRYNVTSLIGWDYTQNDLCKALHRRYE